MKAADVTAITEKFSKISILNISNIELVRWIRKETGMGYAESMLIAKLVKESYRLGEIRGKALK